MESYVKTNNAKWLCGINLIKALLALAAFIFSLSLDHKYMYAVDTSALFLLLICLSVNYIVLQVFQSKGKGAGLIKFWNFLSFIFWIIGDALIVIGGFGILGNLRYSISTYRSYSNVYGSLMPTVIYVVFIALIVYALALTIVETCYSKWIYKTFKHIQKEINANQLIPIDFPKYKLPTITGVKIVLSAIGLASYIFTLFSPSFVEYLQVLANSSFRNVTFESISAFWGITSVVIMIVEFSLVRSCALDFEDAHKNCAEETEIIDETRPEWKCICGMSNSDASEYCWNCHRSRKEADTANLPKIECPHCGAKNKQSNRLCFACNKPLREEAASEQTKSIEQTTSMETPKVNLKKADADVKYDVKDVLEKLAYLHDVGILSDVEYSSKKALVLSQV